MNTAFSPQSRQLNPFAEVSRETIASFSDYADAQAAVDLLSDRGFPVANVTIVGHDLRTVEHVLGRLTKGTAAIRGAGGGAWFGLFVGLLFGIFVPAAGWAWLGVVLGTTAMGAAWGAIFGFFSHWSTRGKRDFAAVQSLEASTFDVLVPTELTVRALAVLGDKSPVS